MNSANKKTYFVSGHLDLTDSEFKDQYVPLLLEIYGTECTFVMGNAPGADTKTLRWLLNDAKIEPSRISIYAYSKNVKKLEQDIQLFKKLGVQIVLDAAWQSATDRDAAMTRASTHDIAWVRSKEEQQKLLGKKYDPNWITGTQANLIRRTTVTKNDAC